MNVVEGLRKLRCRKSGRYAISTKSHPLRWLFSTNDSIRPYRQVRRFSMAESKSQQWTALQVRDTFLDYFKQRGHTFGEQTLNESN